jgi:hypothetical protein
MRSAETSDRLGAAVSTPAERSFSNVQLGVFLMLNRLSVSLCTGIALCCASAVLIAGQNDAGPDSTRTQKSGDILSLDEILQRVKAEQPGKVVETELERKSGRYVYEIDVIGTDGVKKEFKYDAKTGAVISSKIDDEDEDD